MISGVPLSVYDSSLGKYSTIISPSNSIAYIQSALQTLYGVPQIAVYSTTSLQFPNQLEFDIVYIGVKSPIAFTFDTSSTTGGTNNIVTGVYSTIVAYSANNPYFWQIPYDFLWTGESQPSIQLKVNSIPIVCYKCYYQYETQSPVSISSVAYSTGVLSVNLTSTINFAMSDITVFLFGEQCVIQSGNSTSFTCLFNKNPDATFALPTGNGFP